MKNLQKALGALLIGTALLNASSAAAARDKSSPNILLVIADDMGLDATNCYQVGTQQAPMPTLEKLCANGLVFDNAYAAPVCSPTRAGIMSGQYAFQTGVGGAVARRGNAGGLSDSIVSLFDVLATTDYRSALIGKWHIACECTRQFDRPIIFQYFYQALISFLSENKVKRIDRKLFA